MLKFFLVGALPALAAGNSMGCSHLRRDVVAEELAASPDALTEQHDELAIAWDVTGDGKARAVVLSNGAPTKQCFRGTLTWEGRPIPIRSPSDGAVLEAQGPSLAADLTEVAYSIAGDLTTLIGRLHLPRGGTRELAASARASAPFDLHGEVGPHGGKLTAVGDEHLELIANPDSGELRVYVLDSKLSPVTLGGRTITVGVVSDKPQLLALKPGPRDEFARGKLSSQSDPTKITVAVAFGGETKVRLLDHRPETAVAVSNAPPIPIMVRGPLWNGPPQDERTSRPVRERERRNDGVVRNAAPSSP